MANTGPFACRRPKATRFDAKSKKKVALRRFRQIVGKLRQVALILPGIKGLFSPLNRALKGEPPSIGLGCQSEVRAAFLDFDKLVGDLAVQPTHVRELVHGADAYVGYCDAAAEGAGRGVESRRPRGRWRPSHAASRASHSRLSSIGKGKRFPFTVARE